MVKVRLKSAIKQREAINEKSSGGNPGLSFIGGTTSMAQEVTVNGYGTTQNEAERDALRKWRKSKLQGAG